MALPMNDDFADCGLSIDELEAIAAGWPSWVHSAVHGIENGVKSLFTNHKVQAIAAGIETVGAIGVLLLA
jgi:hypothetical protein